jgi:8-amino-7-oxononanoate synthase
MHGDHGIGAELQAIEGAGLLREAALCPGVGGVIRSGSDVLLNFSSNDSLDLAGHPALLAAAAAAASRHGSGAAASRLVTGTLECHEALERRLAAYKGYPAALVFGSGYLANLGLISALAGRDDVVFADRLAHASIVDGIVLSRSRLRRFRHNDAADLERLLAAPAGPARRRIVVTESVFSMDGDLAPLRAIAEVARAHGALLIVDEAHATGVFGPSGAGCVRGEGLEPLVDASMGTLSKALGGYGGFVACSTPLRSLLVNRARSFIYSTALPPSAVGAAEGALEQVQAVPGLGVELLRRAGLFRARLRAAGLDTGDSASQIIPVIVGGNERALSLSRRLRERGIIAVAIREPTVPRGTARLRFSITLAHTPDVLDRAAETIVAAAREEGMV